MGYGGGILLPSNTEAPGNQVDSIPIPNTGLDQAVKGSIKGSMMNTGWLGNKSTSTMGGHSLHDNEFQMNSPFNTLNMHNMSSSQFGQYGQHVGSQLLGNGMDYGQYTMDAAQLKAWQTHDLYLTEKLNYLRREGNERYAEDLIHSYGYEGSGSFGGSVGCCSELDDKANLDFINTLGPKFKTLGDVCMKK